MTWRPSARLPRLHHHIEAVSTPIAIRSACLIGVPFRNLNSRRVSTAAPRATGRHRREPGRHRREPGAIVASGRHRASRTPSPRTGRPRREPSATAPAAAPPPPPGARGANRRAIAASYGRHPAGGSEKTPDGEGPRPMTAPGLIHNQDTAIMRLRIQHPTGGRVCPPAALRAPRSAPLRVIECKRMSAWCGQS